MTMSAISTPTEKSAAPRHFLDLDRVGAADLRAILDRSRAMKRTRQQGGPQMGHRQDATMLAGSTLAMIFEKASTRTRVSFEVAMKQLGGNTVVLRADEMQTKRGETVADTAKVLSRFVDVIMIRTGPESKLHDLAAHATVPVINALTDQSHPCQIMADIMTVEDHRGPIGGKTVAWVGDANNVCTSWIHAAGQFGFTLRIACPEELSPRRELLAWAASVGARVEVMHDPAAAVAGADVVTTDTWVSMGDSESAANRHNLLRPYQVNGALMAKARPDALFLHCLPAHRGEEVTTEVIDGPQSVVWDEAENRLHVQKGILAWCLKA